MNVQSQDAILLECYTMGLAPIAAAALAQCSEQYARLIYYRARKSGKISAAPIVSTVELDPQIEIAEQEALDETPDEPIDELPATPNPAVNGSNGARSLEPLFKKGDRVQLTALAKGEGYWIGQGWKPFTTGTVTWKGDGKVIGVLPDGHKTNTTYSISFWEPLQPADPALYS